MSMRYGSFDYVTGLNRSYTTYVVPETPIAPNLPSGPALSGSPVANSSNAAGGVSVIIPSASIPANTTVVVTIIAGSVDSQSVPCIDSLSNTYQKDLAFSSAGYVYSHHYTSAPGANVTVTANCSFGQIVMVAQAFTGLAAANYVGTSANSGAVFANSTTWSTGSFAANYASGDMVVGFMGTYDAVLSNATANSPYTLDQSLYGPVNSSASMITYYLLTTSNVSTAANGNCAMTTTDNYYAGAVEYVHA